MLHENKKPTDAEQFLALLLLNNSDYSEIAKVLCLLGVADYFCHSLCRTANEVIVKKEVNEEVLEEASAQDLEVRF